MFYSCDNPDFEEFIESTGYFKTAWGSVSDISTIAPALGVAAVNLSSGYFNEHTTKETINVEALLSTIEEAKKILALPCEEPFEYIEATYGHGKYGNWWRDYDEEETSPISKDYTTAYTDSGILMFSNEETAKKYFHVYLLTYQEEEICCEVLAVNEMEAIGIVLSHYQYYSVCDIIDIKSAA